jgi:hypothetical protein
VDTEPAFLALLAGRVAALADCAGAECRRLEDRPIKRDSTPVNVSKRRPTWAAARH